MVPLLKAMKLILVIILICCCAVALNLFWAARLDAANIARSHTTTIRAEETSGYVGVTHHYDNDERWITIKGVFELHEWTELEADVLKAIRGTGDENA